MVALPATWYDQYNTDMSKGQVSELPDVLAKGKCHPFAKAIMSPPCGRPYRKGEYDSLGYRAWGKVVRLCGKGQSIRVA